MKRRYSLAVVWSLGLTVMMTSTVNAQSSGVNVALIDINSVFKTHLGFKSKTEALQAEVKSFEKSVNDKRIALRKDRDKLTTYKTGTDQYNALEKTLTQKLADLSVTAELKRKDVLNREARIYFDTYQDIRSAVSSFARQRRIGLVLRFDSEEIDKADRASVLRGVNRAIVFQDRIDITSDIVRMVNTPKTARRP
jgi:Skp family chaperone for outer membrane proteins